MTTKHEMISTIKDISDKQLQELIDTADIVCYLGETGDDIDIENILQELQTLRAQNKALMADKDTASYLTEGRWSGGDAGRKAMGD